MSGRCRSCGVDLPPELSAIEMMESAGITIRMMVDEVPVYTIEQAQKSMNPFLKPGTVASEFDWSKISAATSEAHLPPSLRSIPAEADGDEVDDDHDEELQYNLKHTIDSDFSNLSSVDVEPEVASKSQSKPPSAGKSSEASGTKSRQAGSAPLSDDVSTKRQNPAELPADFNQTVRGDFANLSGADDEPEIVVQEPSTGIALPVSSSSAPGGSSGPVNPSKLAEESSNKEQQPAVVVPEQVKHTVEGNLSNVSVSSSVAAPVSKGSGSDIPLPSASAKRPVGGSPSDLTKSADAGSRKPPSGSGSNASSASLSTDAQLNIPSRSLSWDEHPDDVTPTKMDYNVVRQLGKGGMGEVWLAQQMSLNREVALKRILPESVSGKSERHIRVARHSFLAEAVVTGDLNHPNIVPVYDLVVDPEGNLVYSMKVVRGTSWDRLIHSYQLTENLEILRKVADAIGFSHSRGIVHRDLKPSNIMVGRYGEVLVMDWGTAFPLPHFSKLIGADSISKRAGTPAYMPPEQAKGDVDATGPHSDVYLLGAILFEIITGKPPHPTSSDTGRSLTRSQLLDNAATNRIVDTTASGELLEIALKAMRTRPEDRYPKVDYFIEALKSYQQHAESVVLSNQAKLDLDAAKTTGDYSMYARALYGFENSLKLWQENYDAQNGQIDTRVEYGNAALKKENFDLGLSLVSDDHPKYQPVYRNLLAAQAERKKKDARGRFFRTAAASLLAVVFIGGTASGLIMYYLRGEALAKAKEATESAEKAELAKSATEAALAEEEKQRIKAVKSEAIAKAAQSKAETAAKEEKAAKEQEKTAKEAAQKSQLAEKDAREAEKKERLKAELATKDAEENAKNAIAQQKIAEAARDAEKRASAKALREWYFSQIGLADQQVAQNAFDSAKEILNQIEEQLKKDEGNLKDPEHGPAGLAKEIGWEFDRLKFVCGLGDDKLVRPAGTGEAVALTAAARGNEFLAAANRRGEVDLWSTRGKREFVRALKTPGQPSALSFSPSGETLAVGNTNGQITLWNPQTGESKGDLEATKDQRHSDEVTRLMYLPEGQLVSTSRDHTARVWNLSDRTFVALKGHSDGIRSLARIADKNDQTVGLLTGDSNKGEVRYWKWPVSDNHKSIATLYTDPNAITSLAAQLRGPNEDLLAVFVGTENGDLKVVEQSLDPKSRLKPHTYDLVRQPNEHHKGSVTRLMLNPANPNQLISTSQDNTIRLWDVSQTALADPAATQPLLMKTLRGHGNGIVDATAWKDSVSGTTRLLTASSDGTARLWPTDEYAEVVSLGGETLNRETGAYGEVLSVSVGNNGERIMGISTDGVATIWNVSSENGRIIKSDPIPMKEGHRFSTQAATFFGDKLVTISFDGTAVVWDRDTGAMLDRWRDVGTSGVLAASADGAWVITGFVPGAKGSDKEDRPNLQVRSLAIDTDRDTRQTIYAVGKLLKNENNNKVTLDAPVAAAFSPDNRYALVGTDNGYLNLIDFHSEDGSKGPVSSAAVAAHVGSKEANSSAPDGVRGVAFLSANEAISAGLDGTLNFWLVQEGKLSRNPARKPYEYREGMVTHRVTGIAVSADGRRVAAMLSSGKSGPEKNKDFRQIWITDLQGEIATPVMKLQPWDSTTKNGNRVKSLSMTADGSRVLALVEIPQADESKLRVLREWNLSGGKADEWKEVLKSSKGFSFDQVAYLTGREDEIVVLSNTLTTVRARTPDGGFGAAPIAAYGPTLALEACTVSSDGKLAVTVSDSLEAGTDRLSGKEPRLTGEVRVWSINESGAHRVGHLDLNGAVRSVAMSPRENDLIMVAGNLPNPDLDGAYSAELYKWNGKNLTLSQRLGNHQKGIVRSRFSADGNKIVTASVDGMVEIFEWDGMGFKSSSSFDLSAKDRVLALGELIAVDLSDDGKLVVAADKTSALVVESATGRPVIDQLIQGHSNDLTEIRFASRPKGRAEAPQRLWTTSLDGTIKFWGIGLIPTNLAAKAEGDANGEGKKEDEKNVARLLLTLRGHQRGVLSLAATPNGGVVTAGKDGHVIIWPISQQN